MSVYVCVLLGIKPKKEKMTSQGMLRLVLSTTQFWINLENIMINEGASHKTTYCMTMNTKCSEHTNKCMEIHEFPFM